MLDAVMPNGRPSMMYYTPHLWGAEDYLVPVTVEDLEICSADAEFRSVPCDIDVYNACVHAMGVHRLTIPHTAVDAIELYLTLRRVIGLLL